MSTKTLFRVNFVNQDNIYELYARQVCESEMFGFVEVGEFVFGETTSVVVDPSEERLRNEFAGVKRCYLPMHAIVRIDEVVKEGVGKIHDLKSHQGNISHLPFDQRRFSKNDNQDS